MDPQTQQPDPLKNLAINLALQQQPPSPAIAAPVQMPEQKPDLSVFSGGQPSVKAPRGTVEGDQNYRGQLLDQGSGISRIHSGIENSQFGQNHPVLGKIAGVGLEGLARLGDIGLNLTHAGRQIEPMIPGTAGYQAAQLGRANSQIGTEQGEQEKQAQTQEAQARVPLMAAQTAEANQKVAAGTPVEITPEQAEQMGAPELAGEKVSPAIMAQLSKQHGINTTKENTTHETVEGRENVAQTGATSKENVAKTNAASKEKIAAESAAVRKTLEGMKEASGISKSANSPTMTTRAMAEMATTVLPRMTDISAEVDRMANDLGPGVGRWNELMVNKGGADHPEFAHLDTDLDLLASAIVRTHFGARGGQQYREELRKQFGEAQSPEDLKARIAAARDWVQGYADMEQKPTSGSQDGSPEIDSIVQALRKK